MEAYWREGLHKAGTSEVPSAVEADGEGDSSITEGGQAASGGDFRQRLGTVLDR